MFWNSRQNPKIKPSGKISWNWISIPAIHKLFFIKSWKIRNIIQIHEKNLLKIQRQRRKILWIFSYLTVVWNWTLLNGNTTNSVVKLDQQGTRCCYVSNFSPNCMNFQFCLILFFPRRRRHVIVQVSNFNYSGLSSPCFFSFSRRP